MFDSDLEKTEGSVVRRRTFLLTTASALAGAIMWSLRRTSIVHATAGNGRPEEVTIVAFSDLGERLKTVRVPKVVKTEEEWRKQLSRGVFSITRQSDTEFAYSGEYWNLHEKGLFRCICCDNALFASDTKFDSGTGWPSFWAPIAAENVRTTRDASLGMVRTAVSCTECDAHLGHVFDDGPEPTGLRYCMNSASLRFVARQVTKNLSKRATAPPSRLRVIFRTLAPADTLREKPELKCGEGALDSVAKKVSPDETVAIVAVLTAPH